MTSILTWKDHIQLICTKAWKLVGMLHRLFSTWADMTTLKKSLPHFHKASFGICLSTVGPLHTSWHSVVGICVNIYLQGVFEAMES